MRSVLSYSFVCRLGNHASQPIDELGFRVLFGMRTQCIGVETSRTERFDASLDCRRRRQVEEHAGLPFNDGIQEPTPTEDGRWFAKSSCFQRNEPVIFMGGSNNSGAI